MLNRLLSSDLRHKSTKILTAEVGTTPQGHEALRKQPIQVTLRPVVVAQHLEDALVAVYINPFSRLSQRVRVL